MPQRHPTPRPRRPRQVSALQVKFIAMARPKQRHLRLPPNCATATTRVRAREQRDVIARIRRCSEPRRTVPRRRRLLPREPPPNPKARPRQRRHLLPSNCAGAAVVLWSKVRSPSVPRIKRPVAPRGGSRRTCRRRGGGGRLPVQVGPLSSVAAAGQRGGERVLRKARPLDLVERLAVGLDLIIVGVPRSARARARRTGGRAGTASASGTARQEPQEGAAVRRGVAGPGRSRATPRARRGSGWLHRGPPPIGSDPA